MLIVLYMQKKKISIFHFLLIPLVDFVCCLPAIMAGRSIGNIMTIYFSQMGSYEYMSMNYPNIWYYFPAAYDEFAQVAILFALAVIGTGVYWVLKSTIKLEGHKLLYFSIWVIFSCCIFLPEMHERYGYAMEILLIIYAVLYKKKIGTCVAVCLVTLAAYGYYFMEITPFPMTLLSMVNIACYLKFSYDGLRALLREAFYA